MIILMNKPTVREQFEGCLFVFMFLILCGPQLDNLIKPSGYLLVRKPLYRLPLIFVIDSLEDDEQSDKGQTRPRDVGHTCGLQNGFETEVGLAQIGYRFVREGDCVGIH